MKATRFLMAAGLLSLPATAADHGDAPLITEKPKDDLTDVYAFRSYDSPNLSGSKNTTVLIMNFHPRQLPAGGPNFYFVDPESLYDIHIDNNGDAVEDVTFRFNFQLILSGLTAANGTEIPLLYNGPAAGPGDPHFNLTTIYSVDLIKGAVSSPTSVTPVFNTYAGPTFYCPPDRFGDKTVPNYQADFADDHEFDLLAPADVSGGRIFAGQRADPFAMNLGEVFDLVNLDPLGPDNAEQNTLGGFNVTSIIIEVPTSSLTTGGDGSGIIGVWGCSSRPTTETLVTSPSPGIHNAATYSSTFAKVDRLGMPLVNELIIGVSQKDRFNNSMPVDDVANGFHGYAGAPAIAALLNSLHGTTIPDTGRADLVEFFFLGLPGVNRPPAVTTAEMIRLDTTKPPTDPALQDPLGVLGGDLAGFPNGRRPGDDVVDIVLRAVGGAFAGGGPPLTDGAHVDASDFGTEFPYLGTPYSPSPDNRICMEVQSNTSLVGPFNPVVGPTVVDDANDTVTVPRTPGANQEFYRGASNVSLRLSIEDITASDVTLKIHRGGP